MSAVETPRERFIKALERKPLTGRVPHFELVFFLTMEKFGRIHPTQRIFAQWGQMSAREQELHLEDMARTYIQAAEYYEHSAIFPQGFPTGEDEDFMRLIDKMRDLSGDRYYLMAHGDATYAMPMGDDMMEFCAKLAEKPQEMCDEAQRRVDHQLERAARWQQHGGLDGWALCSDYCMNTGPFFSPGMFDQFVRPYLTQLVRGLKELGFYVIKHTDGNIMPILDALVEGEPHGLHSLDPQGGVDLAEVKRLIGDKVCLIGNVNCGLMDTGTPEEIEASTRYALEHGMPGYGYIFSTSNCVYTGMPLESYERVHRIWQEEGNYPAG